MLRSFHSVIFTDKKTEPRMLIWFLQYTVSSRCPFRSSSWPPVQSSFWENIFCGGGWGEWDSHRSNAWRKKSQGKTWCRVGGKMRSVKEKLVQEAVNFSRREAGVSLGREKDVRWACETVWAEMLTSRSWGEGIQELWWSSVFGGAQK